MKIYFTGSLHNHDINKLVYQNIIDILKKMGHDIKSDHIMSAGAVDIDRQSSIEKGAYYDSLNKWIAASELVVCEVSYPSTINIGHEVSLALDKGKPVVGLYQKGRAPGVLQGIKSEKFILLEYENDNLEDIIKYGVDEATSQADVRFNFFISPQIGRYLDWMSQGKRIPRAVYLRKLIEDDMLANKEFEKDTN
ncbi:MAG: hypothetical protein WCL07_03755 [bacterium]